MLTKYFPVAEKGGVFLFFYSPHHRNLLSFQVLSKTLIIEMLSALHSIKRDRIRDKTFFFFFFVLPAAVCQTVRPDATM